MEQHYLTKLLTEIVNNCTYTLIVTHHGQEIINMPEVKLSFARGNSLLLFVGRYSNISIRLEDIILIYYDDNLNIFMATSL